MSTELDIAKEIAEANARLPIDMSNVNMPLDITIRSIALSVAQRHLGDATVKEGNLYQQLKMDNKLGDPLSVDMVLRAALIFEMYLWGKWSKDIAEQAIDQTLSQVDDVIKSGALDRHIEGLDDESPIRPHGGGET